MLKSKEAKQPGKGTKSDISWNVPWGTHICLFYETKKDLIDILVPYFRTGLENNEFCMWITSMPLNEKEAKDALRGAMPDFDQYLQGRHIQIVSHSQCYLRDDFFDPQRVLNAWLENLNQALVAGFEGMRIASDGSWFKRKDWAALTKYEEQVNKTIGKYRMIAICSYCIDKCRTSEIIDVVSNHGSALIRRQGKWNVIKSTQHEITKEALRKSEREYHVFSEKLKEVVYRADVDKLQATYVNNAIEKVYGYNRDEWFRNPNLWENTIHPEDKKEIIAKFMEAREKHEGGVLEYRIVRKDNAIRWVEDRYSWEKDDKGNLLSLHGVLYDVTEQKRTEEMLRASEKMAAKGQLAAQIAHEINNPLGGIKNSFLLIKDAIAEDHPYHRYVGLINKEIQRLSDIIRQMFDLYLPNEVTVKKFLIKEVLFEIAKLAEVDCYEHNVVISINSCENDSFVLLPEAPIRQALLNIVKNAVEASPAGAEVKITATVTVDALRLTVSDSGYGIPEQAQSKIFEPFFTSKCGQTSRGLGLGLSVTKEIVEGMGGSISFESKTGQGTVFSIVIPLDRGGKGIQNGPVGANFNS